MAASSASKASWSWQKNILIGTIPVFPLIYGIKEGKIIYTFLLPQKVDMIYIFSNFTFRKFEITLFFEYAFGKNED